ncbi:hypothetical protein P9139_19165 [Curtobacterium flaccumfaciens]|nr:hypothetical protein P9139_19165 [Curtobacterium flaccumfaciens]
MPFGFSGSTGAADMVLLVGGAVGAAVVRGVQSSVTGRPGPCEFRSVVLHRRHTVDWFTRYVRSIELLLTPPSDGAVRAAWAALIDAGLPSLGRHPAPSNAPHVTLAAGPTLPVPTVFDAPVPDSLLLGGVLLFPAGPGRSVLVRALVLDPALAAFHVAVHRAAPDAVDATLPGRWSPHVSFARRVRDADLPRAVEVLRECSLPPTLQVAGSGTGMGRRGR